MAQLNKDKWKELSKEHISETWSFDSLTPECMMARARKLIDSTAHNLDKLLSRRYGSLDFCTFLKAFMNIENNFITKRAYLEFAQYVAEEEDLRAISRVVSNMLREFWHTVDSNTKLFDYLIYYKKRVDMECLTGEMKLYLDNLLQIGYRQGLHLPKDKYERVKELDKEIEELRRKIQLCATVNEVGVEFTRKQLVGVDQAYLLGLQENDDGNYLLSTNRTHYDQVATFSDDPESRRKMEEAYLMRCLTQTGPLMLDVMRLRHSKVNTLGYETSAHYESEQRVLGNLKDVNGFIKTTLETLRVIWDKEKLRLVALKEDESTKLEVDPLDPQLRYWDLKYVLRLRYNRMVKMKKDSFSQYFPISVTSNILNLLQEVLCLKFKSIDGDKWSDSVTVYEVRDENTNKLFGIFYLDLDIRTGKALGTKMHALQPSWTNCVGQRRYPIAAVVANHAIEYPNTPALLTHEEVVDFFRETSLALYWICLRCSYPRLALSDVQKEIRMATARLFEAFAWDDEVLSQISQHHETGMPLPVNLLEELRRMRIVNCGYYMTLRTLHALFDQEFHAIPQDTIDVTLDEYYEEYMGIPLNEDDLTIFGDTDEVFLKGGGQAYVSLWCDVVADDMMFSQFKRISVINPDTGSRFRKYVWCQDLTFGVEERVAKFLGRDPLIDAFVLAINLNEETVLREDEIGSRNKRTSSRGSSGNRLYSEPDSTGPSDQRVPSVNRASDLPQFNDRKISNPHGSSERRASRTPDLSDHNTADQRVSNSKQPFNLPEITHTKASDSVNRDSDLPQFNDRKISDPQGSRERRGSREKQASREKRDSRERRGSNQSEFSDQKTSSQRVSRSKRASNTPDLSDARTSNHHGSTSKRAL